MFNEITVGVDDAKIAIDAALTAARPNDGPVAVAVTDEAGEVVFLTRQDGATAVDVRNAERKAFTAAFIGRDTAIYRLQIAHDGRTVADWSNPKITTLHGGWTLRRQSQVIGGIGVSGTGDEERDERLALAGAEAAAQISVNVWLTKRDARPGLS